MACLPPIERVEGSVDRTATRTRMILARGDGVRSLPRARSGGRLGAAVGFAAAAFAFFSGALAAAPSPRQVVLLYDERVELPGLATIDRSLERELLTDAPWPIEIHRVGLDLSRFAAPGYEELQRDFLRAKFSRRRVDVVIAVMGPSLDFLSRHRDEVFPGAAIVFCGLDRRELESRQLPPRTTGVLLSRRFAPTLEMALRIHPGTREVVFVAGTSDFDARLVHQAREELRAFEPRVRVRFLTDEPLAQLLDQLGRLPPDTLVLYSTLFRDGSGEPFVPHQVLDRVSAAASVPVYGFLDQFLGRGIVGGELYGVGELGKGAASLVRRVLAGEDPDRIATVVSEVTSAQFDWNQMRRWRISPGDLPEGAIVRFRPPTIWRENRGLVLLATSLLLVQGALIGGLLVHRARRRRAETELRESEERFRVLADTTPVLLWLSDPRGRLTFVNQSWLELTGWNRGDEVGRDWAESVHPEDRAGVRTRRDRGLGERASFSLECRLRRRDDSYSWFLVTKVPRIAAGGEFAGFLGSGIDLSAQKNATREMQRSRTELAHVARVATMGEITASVAHELRQPLAAILANAEAGQRLLAREPVAHDEIREILVDIVADDGRAGEILTRIRRLLERHELERTPVAVNEAITDVLRLLGLEATERRVRMRFEPGDDLPLVAGDRVHLQQVVMNLVLNGIDAMASIPEDQRRLLVRTRSNGDGRIEITVADNGPGIPDDRMPRLFEPFWTTKKSGLGMGLSISRSIVESHDGTLRAENGAEGGALFRVELPAIGSSSG